MQEKLKAREQALRRQNEEVRRAAIHRQWRLGLTDTAIARALGMRCEAVRKVREELGLAQNKRQGDW